MRYHRRLAEDKLREMADHFKIVLVVGARQVGKTTLLRHVFPRVKAFAFDPDQDLFGARADPDLFLDNFPGPLLLDEIQHAPELMPALKRRVDESDLPGQYLMSGSQNLMVMREVCESMAGRVGILKLEGLALEEQLEDERRGWLEEWLKSPGQFPRRVSGVTLPDATLPEFLWRGSLPGLLEYPDSLIPDYFRSYVQTYLERDVRSMGGVENLGDFSRFVGLLAALTAQEVNDSQLGRELGVSPPTARRWREILTHSFQWLELPPYHGNTIKRLSGRRKGYFSDTGLACWLQRVSSPESLPVSSHFGSSFESWVVNQVHRQFVTCKLPPAAYHWRTFGGAEVDLVLERDGRLFPIEVKAGTRLSGRTLRGYRSFKETYGDCVAPALVVYAGREVYNVAPDAVAVPWFLL
jgi:uncharacterized protein